MLIRTSDLDCHGTRQHKFISPDKYDFSIMGFSFQVMAIFADKGAEYVETLGWTIN